MKIRDRSTLSLFDSMKSNADRAPIAVWIDPDDPNADNFAGGGGAKLGITNAYETRGLVRRAQDVAVNHWPEALAMYQANHPNCRVYCEDVIAVSARRLAPDSSCADPTHQTGAAEISQNRSPSTSPHLGRQSARSFGSGTMGSVSGADAISTTQCTPSITSAAGLNSQAFDSIARTLFSFVVAAIAGSTLAQTFTPNSFDLEIEVRNRYQIEVLFEGKPLTKTAQTKCVGNSVPPQLAEAVAGAAIETVEYEPGYARAA